MKFLCICLGGNVRSAGLAGLLKQTYAVDALAASVYWNSPETLRMLVAWADHVVLMTQQVVEHLPPDILASPKTVMFDVGIDRFGNPFHPELQAMLAPVVQDWHAREWRIGQ